MKISVLQKQNTTRQNKTAEMILNTKKNVMRIWRIDTGGLVSCRAVTGCDAGGSLGLGQGARWVGWKTVARRAAVKHEGTHRPPRGPVRLWVWPPCSPHPYLACLSPGPAGHRNSAAQYCLLAPVQHGGFVVWEEGSLRMGCRPGRGGHHCSFYFLVHRNLLPCKRLPPSPTAQRCQPEAASCFGKQIKSKPWLGVCASSWMGAGGLELAPASSGPGAPG